MSRCQPRHLRTGQGKSCGTTLLELLIACTLLSILLLATMSVQAQARRASALSQEVAHRNQIAELASELLRYHLGLAGHGGVEGAGPTLGGEALVLDRGASAGGSDALSVRYVEERWYRHPELRILHFDVKRDGSGVWNLYQREQGATRQPAVQEVNALRVVGFVAADGRALSATSELPLEALGIELELGFSWEDRRRLTVSWSRPVRIAGGPE